MRAQPDRFEVTANVVDVVGGRIFPATVMVEAGRIKGIEPTAERPSGYLLPGLVDAHVHIESSLLAPTAFARAAVLHGTVASVSDPHEIANVLGRAGVEWMVADGERSPFKFHFGAPSCVPATTMETSGAAFDAATVGALFDSGKVHYLSEVMNFPGVVGGDPDLLAIIAEARSRGLPVDGHAPGVMGADLAAYAAAGITTDHECFTLEQAQARLRLGMKVAIREGSAARNFDALWPVLQQQPDDVFLCTDDMHPDDLVLGYLNRLMARAVANGVDAMAVIRAATLNPVRHYRLPVGLLQLGDPADMVEVEDLVDFAVRRTWIDGTCVADNGNCRIPPLEVDPLNRFAATAVSAADLRLPAPDSSTMPAIVAEDGQLMTGRMDVQPLVVEGDVVADPRRDLLKLVVINRYKKAPPAVCLVHRFGLRTGAMAGTVAHDSHNIIAVGASDAALVRAINAVIAESGALVYADNEGTDTFPLPIAGLMSCVDAPTAAEAFTRLTQRARQDGCQLRSPFMTLSFMALLVIPKLKLSDLGLFDGERFQLL
jgi:adenine deaminase